MDGEIKKIKYNIKNLYGDNKPEFLKLYGGQLLLTILIIFIFMVFITYYLIANQFPEIRKEWPNVRCNPLYIPLAGFILNEPNKSKWDVVNDNFTGCIQNTLVSIINIFLKPIYYAISTVIDALKEVVDAINNARGIFDRTRNDLGGITKSISARILNFTIPFTKLVIIIKDSIAKSIGIFVTTFFVGIDSFFTIKSTLQTIFLIILDYIIVPTAATSLFLLGLTQVPFPLVSIPAGIGLAAVLILLIALLVVYIPLNIAVSFILGVKPVTIPNYA